MRWEDQELNHGTPENKFPEVFYASLSLPCHAEKSLGRYIHIGQQELDKLVGVGALNQKAKGARIDRLCLYFRLFCRLGPGGDHYPALGVMHFWSGGESRYAIFRFSPSNDWLDLMVLAAQAPNRVTGGIAPPSSHTTVHAGPRTAVPGSPDGFEQHSFSATVIAAR